MNSELIEETITELVREAKRQEEFYDQLADEEAELYRRLADVEREKATALHRATLAWAESGKFDNYSVTWRNLDGDLCEAAGLTITETGRLLVEITAADETVRPVIRNGNGESVSDGQAVWSAFDLAREGFDIDATA